MTKVKTLYRCPICGDVVTDEEYEWLFEIGGNGMCQCDFQDGNRIYYGYDVYRLSKPNMNPSRVDEDKSFKATGQNEKGISEAGNSSADKDVRLSTSKVKNNEN